LKRTKSKLASCSFSSYQSYQTGIETAHTLKK